MIFFFSDSWGRKKPILPPIQKIFHFWAFYGILGEARGTTILRVKSENRLTLLYQVFRPRDGFKNFLMIFSESWDDFRWSLPFSKIFSTFMVFEGYLGETPENDPKLTIKNEIFR